ncbi:MAG: translocation/assembly module TamB domain-containing protein [Pseudomonadota bacterium]
MKRQFAYLLAFATALTLAPQPVPAQEDSGGMLVDFLEDTLSGDGRTIKVKDLEGALSSRATIGQIQISDDEGIWLTINNAVLDWNRLALVRGRFSVNELTADEIIVARAPGTTTTDEPPPTPEAQPFQLPELPVSIEIGEIRVDKLQLDKPLIGIAADLQVKGALSLADGTLDTNLSITRLDRTSDEITLKAGFENRSSQITLDLQIQEAAGGLISTALNMPGQPELSLTAKGAGPVDDFTADISVTSESQPRVAGQVRLRGVPFEADTSQNSIAFTADLNGDLTPFLETEFDPFFGTDTKLYVDGRSNPDGSLLVSDLELSSEALNLTGKLQRLADGTVQLAALQGRIASPEGNTVVLPIASPRTELRTAQMSLLLNRANGNFWDLSLTADALDTGNMKLERARLQAQGTVDQRVINGDLGAALDGLWFADPGLNAAAGDSITLDGFFDFDGRDQLDISQLELTGEDFTIWANAAINGLNSGFKVDGEVRLKAADLSRFAELAGQDLGGSVDADLTGAGTPLGGSFDFVLNASGTNLKAGMPEIDPLITGQTEILLDAVRDSEGLTIRDARLTAAAVEATASARLTQPNGDLTLDGEAAVKSSDLSLFSTLAGYDLYGETDVKFKGVGALQSRKFDARFDVSASGLKTGLAKFDPLLAGRTKIVLDAKNDDQGLTIRTFDIDGQALTAAVTGTVTGIESGNYAGDASVQANIPDLSLFSALSGYDLGGSVDAQIEGTGALADQSFDGTLSVNASGLKTGLAEYDPVLDGKIAIALDAKNDAEGLTIRKFDINGRALTANGSGTFSGIKSGDYAGDATVQANIPDLSRFSALAGYDLGGSIDAQIKGTGALADQSFDGTLSVNASGLKTGLAEYDPLLDGKIAIALDAKNDAEGLTVRKFDINGRALTATGSGTFTGLQTGDYAGTAKGQAQVPDLSLFSALSGLNLAGSVATKIDGSGTLNDRLFDIVWSLDANNLKTGIAQADALIEGRTRLDLNAHNDGEGLTIRDFKLAGNALTASAKGELHDVGGKLSFSAALDEIGRVTAVTSGPLKLNGEIARQDDGLQGQVRLDGPNSSFAALDGSVTFGGDADFDFDAQVGELDRFIAEFPGTLAAKGSARRAQGIWTIDANAQGPGGIRTDVSGNFDESSGEVDMTAKGQVSLAVANQFITPNKISGTAQFDVSIAGPPGLGAVSGTISTSGGSMAIPAAGQTLTDIGGTVRIANSAANIALTAGLRAGGGFRVSGPVSLVAPFKSDIVVDLNQLILTDNNFYESSANGQIRMSGELAGNSSITGQILIGETNINLAAATGAVGAAPIPDMTHIGESRPVYQTLERARLISKDDTGSGSQSRIALDVNINAPNRIFVRGRGVNAELGGAIDVRGTTSSVQPSGQIGLIRGKMSILGRSLELTKGIVTLQGNLTPYIEFVSTSSTSDGQATIEISGPLDLPEVKVYSDPERPPEEALAMLLFGNSFSQLSPFVIAQMAASLAELSGARGDSTKGLRESTGADNIELGATEGGGGSLGAGAYLGENLYTDFTVNTQGDTEVNLNLDVTDNFTVRGTVDNTGETGIGFFFQRDY